MTQVLQMTFANDQNKTMTVNVNDPKENVTAAEVSTVMDTIIESAMFVKEGSVFNTKKSARIVDRVVTDFDIN